MRKESFPGGIHIYDGKELSKDVPIRKVNPPGDYIFPMRQHIGTPAEPVVRQGDRVLTGQIIGKASGNISANICSSVSGIVKNVRPVKTFDGSKVMGVVIANDGQYNTIPNMGKERNYKKISSDKIINIIKEAGIVGMGGAGFPTSVKLTPKNPSAIEYILVNGAECEPYVTTDYRQMMECTDELIGGLCILLGLFKNAKGIICVEDNKPEAIAVLEDKVIVNKRIVVKTLPAKYPQGSERALIYAVTGRKIYSGRRPADAGCIVNNVSTVIAIYNAVCRQTPLIKRVLTLTGGAFTSPSNIEVPIGCILADLIREGGGFKVEPKRLILGGIMMGRELNDIYVPVTKTSSSVIALTETETAEYKSTPCIRCGRCAAVCPNKLMPQKMAKALLNDDYDGFMRLNGMECYECGCCTYICPARRPLTQIFRQAYAQVHTKTRARINMKI